MFFLDRIQSTGLGGLKPNTVIFGWPHGWRNAEKNQTWRIFIDAILATEANKMALIVPKGIEHFPESTDKVISYSYSTFNYYISTDMHNYVVRPVYML